MGIMTNANKALAIAGGILAALVLVFLGFALGGYAEIQRIDEQNAKYEPYCPTEDSCRADYRDGHWWIIEQTP